MNFSPELAPASSPQPLPATEDTPRLAKAAVVLAILTFLTFLPVVDCEWLNYDDDAFVTNNPKVAAGLTWAGVKWAFTSADIDFWRPLSWLSHMVDVELFGSVAGGHHLTNLLIHCASVIMALLALHRLTRRFWPSMVVAALFAIHPLHVESVAWIAERKDVLCGFFFWLALWCHAAYAAAPSPKAYLRLFCAFLLGVMSKPMIVTLPCVLLLLDFWPLNRIKLDGSGWRGLLQQGWPLVREKLPLFAIVLVLGLSTIYSQHRVGTMATLDGIPLLGRVQSSLYAYGKYLTLTLVPTHLCVLYPLEPIREVWRWLCPALLLLSVAGLGIRLARRQPWLIVGWLWFVGMLVPVIGLMQVGEQAHADRYTYLPLNGLFIMLVWTVAEWLPADPRRQRWLAGFTVVVLVLCGWRTRDQLQYWRNGLTAFGRALVVTEFNPTALNNLGNALRTRDRVRESIPYFAESARLRPAQNPLLNLGICYLFIGEEKLGLYHVRRGLAMDPHSANAKDLYATISEDAKKTSDPVFHKLLAVSQATRGRYEEAARHLEAAAKLRPRDAGIYLDQASYLAMGGRETEAMRALERVLELEPGHPLARANLASLLTKQGKLAEAAKLYEAALAADPNNHRTLHNYALLLIRSGRYAEARRVFERVLALEPQFWPTHQQMGWLLSTRTEVRDAPAALRHAWAAVGNGGKTPQLLDVAAVAEAANGNFEPAIRLAREALALIQPNRDQELAAAIRLRLAGYQAGRPHTEPPPPATR